MSTVEQAQEDAVREIVGGIEDGTFDLYAMEAIERAIQAKRDEYSQGWRGAIQVGWKVRIVDSVSPKWMAGRTGTVSAVKGNRFEVELDYGHTMRNGRSVRRLNAYASHLEPAGNA